jgi:hypothetical protein
MRTYSIPESLDAAYKGSGWAVAATLNGVVVGIRYIEDVAPEIDLDDPYSSIAAWIESPAAAPVVRELQALGQVCVGMVSNWTLTEL